jgi:hypothetical protein
MDPLSSSAIAAMSAKRWRVSAFGPEAGLRSRDEPAIEITRDAPMRFIEGVEP